MSLAFDKIVFSPQCSKISFGAGISRNKVYFVLLAITFSDIPLNS